MSRFSLHFDDGTKIDFETKEDALYHCRVQGVAGVEDLHEEASPEEHLIAHLEGALAAVKGGEPATGDPYRVVSDARGKKAMTRKQIEKAIADIEVLPRGEVS